MRINIHLKDEGNKVIQGLQEAYKKLVEYKEQKNSPMVVMRDGMVVEIDANEILPTTFYKRNAGMQ